MANDQTPTDQNKQDLPESSLFGISIRGIIALVLIVTVCGLNVFQIEVKEPLYTLVMTVVAFYFGHQTAVKQSRK